MDDLQAGNGKQLGAMISKILLLWLFIQTMSTEAVEIPEADLCRDRLGHFYKDDFKISSCSLCYFYLVLNQPKFVLQPNIKITFLHHKPYYLIRNDTISQNEPAVYPSFDNQASVDNVCATLNDVECTRWVTCCKDAWACCQQQVIKAPPSNGGPYCPQTFDGWSCWNFTLANRTVYQECPSFLKSSSNSAQSKKVCGGDGSWATDNATGLEYTNYDACSQTDEVQIYKIAIILGIVLNALGVVLIVPAITVFLHYRSLRKQQRIKIHLNLFLSILLTSVLALAWDVFVRLDRLDHTEAESVLHSQQTLCKTLHVLYRFARASEFFWMSCEGFFLHRLMVNAFLPPKHFYGYLIYGWGIPVLLFSLYGGIRKYVADDDVCWIVPLSGSTSALEWVLVFVPTIICFLANVLFLCNILKMLLTKMVTHPNEPSNFRKALKATVILIPLFGIHQFCLIYRPTADEEVGYRVYEIASAVILNSQAIIISLVFCYFNGEVQSHIQSSCAYMRRRYSKRRQSDDRKLSLSVDSTSRRTSVSSLQNGGLNMSTNTTENSLCGNGVNNEGFCSSTIGNVEQITAF